MRFIFSDKKKSELQLFSHALPEKNDNFNFHLQRLFQGTWLRFLFLIRELTRTICFTIHSTKSFKVADHKIDNHCWCFNMKYWLSVDIRLVYVWGTHHFIGLPGFRFSPKPLVPNNAGFWVVHWLTLWSSPRRYLRTETNWTNLELLISWTWLGVKWNMTQASWNCDIPRETENNSNDTKLEEELS